MIERYIEITCDGCGEIEWSPANVGMAEFKADFIPSWKHRGAKSLCPNCVDRGVRWRDAKVHEAALDFADGNHNGHQNVSAPDSSSENPTTRNRKMIAQNDEE